MCVCVCVCVCRWCLVLWCVHGYCSVCVCVHGYCSVCVCVHLVCMHHSSHLHMHIPPTCTCTHLPPAHAHTSHLHMHTPPTCTCTLLPPTPSPAHVPWTGSGSILMAPLAWCGEVIACCASGAAADGGGVTPAISSGRCPAVWTQRGANISPRRRATRR